MEVIEETVYSEILIDEGENSWQLVCGNDDERSVLGHSNEGETLNLFALTSELSWLGDKAEEVGRFLQSESHDEPHQGNSALNSIICQVITTSTSILSQCQRLSSAGEEEVVEMEEAEVLAEPSHLCSICGKEFRRDGNLRIHMRSHGEKYKSKDALISIKSKGKNSFHSCPFQGCRHNRRHPNFKRLKSIVSLRNHYRRSHCAKMYSCNKCGKKFSFVGDLKTHGNKCGHSTWRCSCTLTFPTRNKLLRHVALGRQGHKPVPAAAVGAGNGESSTDSDQDVLIMGVGSNSIEHNEYGYEKMENEFTLSSEDSELSELYASLFWPNGDLLWP